MACAVTTPVILNATLADWKTQKVSVPTFPSVQIPMKNARAQVHVEVLAMDWDNAVIRRPH